MLMDIEWGRGPQDEIKKSEKKSREEKLYKRRLIAKRILIGSGLAFAIGFTSGMISSTINQNKVDDLIEEKNKLYEQYMSSDEFKTYYGSQITQLADDYASGRITYTSLKAELDRICTPENADQLLEGTNHELKDNIEQLDKQINDIKQKDESGAINKASVGLVCASLATVLPSGIVYMHCDLEIDRNSKTTHKKKEEDTLTK